MAADMFFKIGDIKGEATDSKHKDEIEVMSWSWGISNAASTQFGGGSGVGKANFADLTFTHFLDKASPNLMKLCTTGDHVKEATLTIRKAGGKEPQEYLIIKLTSVFVTSVQPAGSGGDKPVETVSLTFEKVDVEYKPQKDDGSLDAGIHYKWNLKQNKEA